MLTSLVFVLLFAFTICTTAKPQQNRGHNGSFPNPSPAHVLSLARPVNHGSSSLEDISTNFSPEFFLPKNLTRSQSQQQQFPVPVQTTDSPNATCPRVESEQYKPDFDSLEIFPRLGFHVNETQNLIHVRYYFSCE